MLWYEALGVEYNTFIINNIQRSVEEEVKFKKSVQMRITGTRVDWRGSPP
jgi:hypothetical protein